MKRLIHTALALATMAVATPAVAAYTWYIHGSSCTLASLSNNPQITKDGWGFRVHSNSPVAAAAVICPIDHRAGTAGHSGARAKVYDRSALYFVTLSLCRSTKDGATSGSVCTTRQSEIGTKLTPQELVFPAFVDSQTGGPWSFYWFEGVIPEDDVLGGSHIASMTFFDN